jgi:hypothetical protein
MYSIRFFGGPRDGDEVYQFMAPPEIYDTPIHINMGSPEILGIPVTVNEPLIVGTEAHHYELVWIAPYKAIFRYRGVVVS